MVAKRYFAHDSRSGARFSARIARTGWMSGRAKWSVGENIAWGSGSQAAPPSIVAAWMRSAGHRKNILSSRFRVIGIGIVRGAPAVRRRRDLHDRLRQLNAAARLESRHGHREPR